MAAAMQSSMPREPIMRFTSTRTLMPCIHKRSAENATNDANGDYQNAHRTCLYIIYNIIIYIAKSTHASIRIFTNERSSDSCCVVWTCYQHTAEQT